MSKIKLYGTLQNDTREALFKADEVYDTRESKPKRSVAEIIDKIEKGHAVAMSEWEVEDMLDLIANRMIAVKASNEPWNGEFD